MNKRTVLYVIAANVLALIALTFIYPEFMVSPGDTGSAHASLGNDCFACHQPFMGASETRCQSCHKLADIGIKDTQGQPLARKGKTAKFHHALANPDCMGCHSIHKGSKLTQGDIRTFSHDLLPPDIRRDCASCHTKPTNALHRPLTANCSACHNSDAWKPAQFSHETLPKTALAQCQSCHEKPQNRMHRPFTGSCGSCHSTKAWEPATFNHNRYFVLDKDHNTDCATCHTGNLSGIGGTDFKQYTCYGCHEHTPAKIRAEHLEEGIRNFNNCVKCHRDPRVEPEGRGESGGDDD